MLSNASVILHFAFGIKVFFFVMLIFNFPGVVVVNIIDGGGT